jgi:hypothetical protein
MVWPNGYPYVRGSCRTGVSRDCAVITARDDPSAGQASDASWGKYGRLARGGLTLDLEGFETRGNAMIRGSRFAFVHPARNGPRRD